MNNNEKKITIEIIVPDDAGNDAIDMVALARETFHGAFAGSEDYVNDNVVVWDNTDIAHKGVGPFNETGLVVDFKNCHNCNDVGTRFMEAITDLIGTPEWIGMTFRHRGDKPVQQTTNPTCDNTDENVKTENKLPNNKEVTDQLFNLYKQLEKIVNVFLSDNTEKG